MKKKLLAAAILAALTLSSASVFAAVPTPAFSGDFQLLTQKGTNSDTYTDVRIRLNIDAQLEDSMYIHGRLMGIDESWYNYGTAGTGSKGAIVNMEQMFIGQKMGAADIRVGRQPMGLGRQGLLADVNGVQGVSLAYSAENFNAMGIVGRSNEGPDDGAARDTVGARIGTVVNGVNVDVAYMTTDQAGVENKYWSASADTKIAQNVILGGEYIKNTIAKANGFLVKATVGQLAKKHDMNYAVSYRQIEDRAVDNDWVTMGNYADSKGFRATINYKINNSAILTVFQDFTKKDSNNETKNQFRTELNVYF